jgi:high-affinity nickel-transport protein
MNGMPGEWTTLLSLVFALGLRHGLDADHLATIDGIARFNAERRRRLSAASGMLFSLGHGAVVVAAALAVAAVAGGWNPPEWLTDVGAWVSIACLSMLGVLNLRGILRAPAGHPVALSGLRARWFRGLACVSRPLGIVGVGAVFAISLDTLSQAALIALAASAAGGWPLVALAGAAFTLGMLVPDGANGWWVARIARSANRRGAAASRVMGLVVGVLSLAVAGLGLAKYFFRDGAAHLAGHPLALSMLVIGIVAAGFAVAVGLSRTRWSRRGAAGEDPSAVGGRSPADGAGYGASA